jgi:hypothetical protein
LELNPISIHFLCGKIIRSPSVMVSLPCFLLHHNLEAKFHPAASRSSKRPGWAFQTLEMLPVAYHPPAAGRSSQRLRGRDQMRFLARTRQPKRFGSKERNHNAGWGPIDS